MTATTTTGPSVGRLLMAPTLVDADTVTAMMRWLPRILLLVTVAGLLAMHGVDSTSTSEKPAQSAGHHAAEPMPDVAGESAIAAPDNSRAGGALDLHHVAAACVVAVAAVVVARARRFLTLVTAVGTTIVHDVGSAVVRAIDQHPRPPEPGWVRLCVIRR